MKGNGEMREMREMGRWGGGEMREND